MRYKCSMMNWVIVSLHISLVSLGIGSNAFASGGATSGGGNKSLKTCIASALRMASEENYDIEDASMVVTRECNISYGKSYCFVVEANRLDCKSSYCMKLMFEDCMRIEESR